MSPLRVASACAGDGRDLLEVLAGRSDADRVRACLLELDPVLAARARERAGRLSGIEVRSLDAGLTDSYLGAVPANLLMLCGVLGNITDDDVRATISAAPALCAEGAEVIWTRGAWPGDDRTPQIRRWFDEAGFEELSFEGPPATGPHSGRHDGLRTGSTFRVGAHRLVTPPRPFQPGRRLFTFAR